MSEDVHGKMLKFVKEDPKFKKKSAQAKKNKRGGSETNKVVPGHCQGSVSTNEYAKRMVSLVTKYLCSFSYYNKTILI